MSSTAIVSTLLPLLGFVNGAFMAVSPAKAGKKIYKFDEKEVKPQVIDLIQTSGASALSLSVLEGLLSFTNMDCSNAVAIAMIPRVSFLIFGMVQQSKMGSELLEPKNLIKIVLATILIEGGWMNPKLSLQVRGVLYFCLGLLFTLAPGSVAKRTNQFDVNPTIERCLRAKGKMDIVFGALVYCLVTMTYLQSLGCACLAWLCASLYADFIISTRDRFRTDAFVQILIASASAITLLPSA